MKKKYVIVCALFYSVHILAQNAADYRKFFNYDKGLDSQVAVISKKDTTGCSISEISFRSTNNIRVTAYQVIPDKMMRSYPAVIFLHGTGFNKEQFLSNAISLADESIASLLIDEPPLVGNEQRMTYFNFTEPEKDFQTYKQIVIDLRRSIDMLEKQSQIDGSRLAFIGFERGAWAGAVLSGIEMRISTYILISGAICPACDIDTDPKVVTDKDFTPEQKTKYIDRLRFYEPSNFLKIHGHSGILFQNTENIPEPEYQYLHQLYQSTPEPKQQKIYKSTSTDILNCKEATLDRTLWLQRYL